MSIPARYDIYHKQGDTYSVTLTVEGDKTASAPKFEITLAGSSVLELTQGSGITELYNGIDDVTVYGVTITAAQSAALLSTSIYNYDFQLSDAGIITTYLSGLLTLQGEFAV